MTKDNIKEPDVHLVVTPPFFTKMPNIGVGYLASFLSHKGFEVSVTDLSVKLYNSASPEMKRFWSIDCVNNFFQSQIAENIFKNFRKDLMRFVEEFLASNVKVIGFSVNMISIYTANAIARLIKMRDPQRFIIFGGPGTFYSHPRDQIRPSFADVYVVGEGEFTLFNILDAYFSNREIPSDVPGILLVKDLGKKQPLQSPNIPDLDQLPYPTFFGFDLKEYNQPEEYKPVPILFSRGCIRRCAYCIDYYMWPKYRSRSPRCIMDEIEYHVKNNNARAFEVIDLTCNGNLRQLSELCDLIIASGLEFTWVSYAIIRKDMSLELLQKIKKANCDTLIYGVENGSDRVLKLMGKSYTAEEASEVIKNTHKAGIRTNINIIVGFPGETEEDFKQTIKFVYQNRNYINEVTNISGCTLFPTADIGLHKEKYGLCWEEGTEPMFFHDINGLGREGRNERVTRLVEIVNKLNLSKSIVNRPSLNPEVKEIMELLDLDEGSI
jgi:anaerobic magnesium-protoporphyrin IX monomethyl ester cyclase